MSRLLVGSLFLAAASLTSAPAFAKGCIKGALVGGVAGHMVGHGVMGAAAGCVYGRHKANKQDRQQAAQPNGQAAARR